MTPIIRKFVLKLLSKDRGSGITSLPGAQHRMIQESIITDTLLKKGVNPETITSEGMLQSILNGIKKEEAMIARSKAEAQKNLATVMDMKGRKIKPGAKIMGGEEVVETEAEIAERLGKGNKQAVENIKEKQLIESFDPDEMASGGRAGFAGGGMGRRAFLKLMAALGATGATAKSGLVSLLGKGAGKEVAKEVVQQSTSTPPPYFFNLVKKIKNLGDDVTPNYAVKERDKVTQYKDFELTEDLTTGEQTIKRVKISDDGPQYYDETLAEETYMNYKPGKGQMDETTGKVADEYIEDTSYLRTSGPSKGDIYDTVDGVADDVIEEGTIFEDNIADFTTKKLRKKKASGGLAYMVGE